MATPLIPVKTADGLAELSQRQRRLSQRHRTVLLLVDGRRNELEVRSLAQQAGAGASCFGELLDLGLIALPPAQEPPITTVPIRPRPDIEVPLHIDIPIGDDAPPAGMPPPPAAPAGAHDSVSDPESLLPAARTLQPESTLSDLATSQSTLEDFDALDGAPSNDPALEEARAILLRAVRAEAPLAGSLTILRLRRARTRSELAQLIHEVEARIIKPYRSLAAQQVLRRARHLLATRVESVQTTG